MAASDDEAAIRRIARAVVSELENTGKLTDAYEAKAIMNAASDAELFWCESCGAEFDRSQVTQSHCPECGHRRATTAPPYTCTSCGRPVSLGMDECPSCHSKQASRTAAVNPDSSRYECLRCGRSVSLEQSACVCGETRAVERIGGRPAEMVVT